MFLKSFLAGGAAGLAVDMSLFPLDTIKTRLQAKGGFFANGGFRHIYSGLSSAAIGSVPGAALFFSTYEFSKHNLCQLRGLTDVQVHMLAAISGEAVACLVRVPTEMVKQRMQANNTASLGQTCTGIYRFGGLASFYQGYPITLVREIPFAIIQFPLFEYLKLKTASLAHNTNHGQTWNNYLRVGLCGSISGAVAAALTTPIDALKTRIMLSHGGKGAQIAFTLRELYKENGMRTFFKGIGPRSFWIGIGGFIFFSVYDTFALYL